MRKHFKGFWLPCDQYTNPISVTDEMIAQAEKKLNFKLPRSYIELIKTKNGSTLAFQQQFQPLGPRIILQSKKSVALEERKALIPKMSEALMKIGVIPFI
ncbi:SUKH superfamily protein [Laceyella sediminis]|uniref:SUKH superfamily protein n=1 Tax=Laceyella sediminis TaxID=573074 RepID=A0ABX5EM27_9BACL|nr:SMI1/KNR4 family protein [Laceyella sediminis]PRZ11749.1 SUKH superfamily protein [Laceyella sediminis]